MAVARDQKVMIRMTLPEKRIMLKAARRDDRSLSDWIRHACANAAEAEGRWIKTAEERGNGK